MGFIKNICFLLLTPVITIGQTVHIDSDKVVYKGKVKLDCEDKNELFARAKNTIQKSAKGSKELMVTDSSEKKMVAVKGSLRLSSPYNLVKTVEYILELSVNEGEYEYRIDSVCLKEIERGGKTTKISSEKLLKGMEVSGSVSAETEKQLNEIDMHFQKFIDLLTADMKGISVKRSQ